MKKTKKTTYQEIEQMLERVNRLLEEGLKTTENIYGRDDGREAFEMLMLTKKALWHILWMKKFPKRAEILGKVLEKLYDCRK